MKRKRILICGGAGFIGRHLAKRLSQDPNNVVIIADIKSVKDFPDWEKYCSTFYNSLDLTKDFSWEYIYREDGSFDEIYQLAADMGGAGYIFTGENDFSVMTNSAAINLHAVKWAYHFNAKIFYSSSACIYPAHNQTDPNNPLCTEESAYPANPDSEYGWEKLFSERLYLAAHRNLGLQVRIARFHNIFGPEGTYDGGREKSPAAICRKVIMAPDDGSIDIWGTGEQTRSFLYIDECIEGVLRLMESDFTGPVNIGSEEMISINDLAKMIIKISGKNISIRNVPGPIGVMGRNSDNTLLFNKLGWEPAAPLINGITETYAWIKKQIESNNKKIDPRDLIF